jgi:hypothetical protein
MMDMKRFLLISVFMLFYLIGKGQKKLIFQISPSYFFGNSVIVKENTSFVNLKEETHLLNQSKSYGVNFYFTWRDRFSYYQSKTNGFRIGILKSTSNQSITYNYTPNLSDSYTVKELHQFIDIPILFTQSATNHQIFIFEGGPMYSYYINNKKWYFSAVGKMGVNNHIGERITYSILFANYYTRLTGNDRFRMNNGLEFNLIFKLTSK